MSDIHALVGAYAIDALDDLERAAFERHLAECPACQSEVAGLREASAMIGSTVPVQPSAGLRDRVLADIATVRPLPPAVDRPAAAAPGRRTRFRPRALLAAAAAVIALGAGAAAITQPWQDDSSQTVTVADQIRAADDAETYTHTLDGGATATITRSQSMNQAVLETSGMPDAPSGSVYELWLLHDEQMVPAGLMTGGDHEIVLEGDPATAQGVGITVEPDGGSDEPSGDPIALIEFQQA
jgi:anti-sigma factor RsiW